MVGDHKNLPTLPREILLTPYPTTKRTPHLPPPSILIRLQHLLNPLTRQPPLRRNNPPRDEPKNRHNRHNNRRVIQALGLDRENIWRKQHRHDPPVPKHPNHLKRLAPPPQTPARRRERLGRQQQPPQADEAVRRGRRHARGRDERGEGDARGEDGAGDEGGDAPDDKDCVFGLAGVDLRDPGGVGEDAVAGDGEDEAGGGDDGDGGVLWPGGVSGVLGGERVEKGGTRTNQSAMTQTMFMTMWPPRPRTTA